MALLCVGNPQIQSDAEPTRRLLRNSGAVAFAVEQEIQGYQLGVTGSKCPSERARVHFQEDCAYALQQFRADHAVVPVDTIEDHAVGITLPQGCSYNTQTQRGVWNLNWASSVEEDTSSLKPVCYDNDEVYEVPQQCHIEEKHMWDDWCCSFGMDECPSDYTELGIAADPNNSWWLHRYYRVCQKEVCSCPSDTREYRSQTTNVNGVTRVDTTCFSAGTFGTQSKAVNFVHSHPAYNTQRGGLCTCPNGEVYAVGTTKAGDLACHSGTAGEIVDTSNTAWAHGDVVCATCQGAEVSVACGTMSNGMGLVYHDFEAWMGVYNLNEDVQDAVATFQFRCSHNVAQFRIRANAFAPTGSDNSFFLEVDTAGPVAWHLPKYARGVAESTSPSLGSVATGTHTLSVSVREDGTFFASLTMDNDGCEFVVDNSQPGDREEFALVADTSCGGTSLDLTGGHQWYANSCAEVCAAEECAGYEKTKDEPCRFFGGSLSPTSPRQFLGPFSPIGGPGCYVKTNLLAA